MPIDKTIASKLCRKYLASIPDFQDRERVAAVAESVAEACATEYQAQKVLARWRMENRTMPTYADISALVDQTPLSEPAERPHCSECGGSGWRTVDVLITLEPRPEGRTFRRVERIKAKQAQTLQWNPEFRAVQKAGTQMLNTGAERCGCVSAVVPAGMPR